MPGIIAFGMLCALCISIFGAVILFVQCFYFTKNYIVRLEYTTLRDMIRVKNKSEQFKQDGKLDNLPYLTQYLSQSEILIEKLCNETPNIIIKRVSASYQENLKKELMQAPKEILDLILDLSQAIENWRYRKHPIIHKLHIFKKNLQVRILYCILCLLTKIMNYSESRAGLTDRIPCSWHGSSREFGAYPSYIEFVAT